MTLGTVEQACERWPQVAVVGAGAVGCYFGGMLARAGAAVTLIGRPAHVDAIADQGLLMEGLRVHERIAVAAATDFDAVDKAQVILVCVKTVDTEIVAKALEPHLASGSAVISLQNGVDNIERIRAATQIQAIPAAVYVAAAMVAPGHIKHSGRGDLILGHALAASTPDLRSSTVDLQALARMFERAQIPCRISQHIEMELWTKMVLNCAFNAISALGRSRYGRMMRSPAILELMRGVIAETVAVARADGIALSEEAMLSAALQLGDAMSGASSSTAQDISRGKPTEIDALNGYIARRGAALAMAVPLNQSLYTLVKLLEQSSDET